MSSVLICAFASTGTAENLVGVAELLLQRGHRVTVVAGTAAESAYADLDVLFAAVPEADLPMSREARPPFWQRVSEVFTHVRLVYVDPAPQQWVVVQQMIEFARVDVVMTDGLFLGASLLAYLPRDLRPAVLDLGMFPLSVPDPAVPPYGFGIPPIDSLARRVQALGLELAATAPYLTFKKAFTTTVEQLTGVRPQGDIRAAILVADVWAQLSIDRFEYPRRSMPANVRFVGALRARPTGHAPEWWRPDEKRLVVAVLTDTGAHPRDLVLPTVHAFADHDALVVISGATREDVEAAYGGPLPETVRFATNMPWEHFTRATTVAVSTGDYVHTQYALMHGIPVVAAGTYGHQVETAARVDWAGIGIDLHTRRPHPGQIREAVERIQTDSGIRNAVARIAAQNARHNAETTLADLVDELTSPHHRHALPADSSAPVAA